MTCVLEFELSELLEILDVLKLNELLELTELTELLETDDTLDGKTCVLKLELDLINFVLRFEEEEL